MPVGNGDVAAGVWVEEATGDLRMHVSKSDVFDENSQPVKVRLHKQTRTHAHYILQHTLHNL